MNTNKIQNKNLNKKTGINPKHLTGVFNRYSKQLTDQGISCFEVNVNNYDNPFLLNEEHKYSFNTYT